MINIVKSTKRKIKQYLLRPGRIVDFLICGTQKGGTSSLHSYLKKHPDICMANRKEVHFFDNETNFSRGKPDYFKYHSYFSPKKNHRIMGETTPIYMYWDNAPGRIFDYNPKIKLIILLRNPIERAYSHWNMQRNRGFDNFSFWDSLNIEEERRMESYPLQNRKHSYTNRGFYLKQLKKLWSYFPRDRVLILKSEDLKGEPEKTLNHICNFLQISQFSSIISENDNLGLYKSSMSEKEKNYLKSIFEQEIKELEAELNWDCSEWLNG